MNTTKVCSKCLQEKPADEFSPRLDRPIGLYSCCKRCKADSRIIRYKERRIDDPVTLWITNARNWSKDRAKKRAVPFSITTNDIKELLNSCKSLCTYCNRPLNFRRTIATRTDSPTLDRIIPKLGYTPINLVICCHRCNMLKNEALPEELENMATVVRKLVSERNLLR